MLSETLKKFGYPATLIKEYPHWIILCRPKQVTLGSLILICKDEVNAFSKISPESFNELPLAICEIETNTKRLFGNEKINYCMFMMVDPEVHFHVIPRYSSEKVFKDVLFTDKNWPKGANLEVTNEISSEVMEKLIKTLQETFHS